MYSEDAASQPSFTFTRPDDLDQFVLNEENHTELTHRREVSTGSGLVQLDEGSLTGLC